MYIEIAPHPNVLTESFYAVVVHGSVLVCHSLMHKSLRTFAHAERMI
jgi:phage-related protein